jgi:hypothetical protein
MMRSCPQVEFGGHLFAITNVELDAAAGVHPLGFLPRLMTEAKLTGAWHGIRSSMNISNTLKYFPVEFEQVDHPCLWCPIKFLSILYKGICTMRFMTGFLVMTARHPSLRCTQRVFIMVYSLPKDEIQAYFLNR